MMIDYTGQQVGNYRLVRRLGIGGFASVYQGQHVRISTQQVAIKILHLSDVDTQKFQQEAETTAILVHPNIIRLFDFDVSGITPFLIMDYAPGGSLRARHPQGTQLPLATVVKYIQVIAGALQYAHHRNVIHRDIKPDNILIGAHDELRLSDFGIAVLSQTGRTTLNPAYGTGGTPLYMAPEQSKGKPEKASDQYALAIMAYEWLCGKPPFSEGNAINIQFQHTYEPVPPLREQRPTLPAAVERVILKALAKDPQQRYQSITTFAQALASVAEPRPQQPQQPHKQARPSPRPTVVSPPIKQAKPQPGPPETELDRDYELPTPRPDPSQSSNAPVSRRTIIVTGVSVGAVVLGGGLYWFTTSYHGRGTPLKASTPHTHPTPTPTPIPLGKLLFTYRGHTNSVDSVAWSPNDKRIASASTDKTVQIWNADGSGSPFTYKGHTDYIRSVAWSPDGKRIASASDDKTVQVWNADSSGSPFIYKGHTDIVNSVAWSPNGKRIASASLDNTVQVWNADGSGSPFIYRGHTNYVLSVAWSPDGKRIASASIDKTVQVWNADGNGSPFTYKGHADFVYSVAWSPDGKRIASGSTDKTVQVWNADGSGSPFTYRGHTYGVYSVTWSPNGTRIASGAGTKDRTVQVWNVDGSGSPFTYRGHTGVVLSVAWSPDGTRIASASADETVQVWGAG